MDGSGNFTIAWRRGSPAAIGAEGHYRYLLPPLRADGHHDRQRARRAIQRRRGQPDQRAFYTGVRALAAPTQLLTLEFNPTIVGPYAGTFELLVGSAVTTPISFSSADLPTSAANIESALVNLGYAGTLVTVVGESTSTTFGFDISLNGATANMACRPSRTWGPCLLGGVLQFGHRGVHEPATDVQRLTPSHHQFTGAVGGSGDHRSDLLRQHEPSQHGRRDADGAGECRLYLRDRRPWTPRRPRLLSFSTSPSATPDAPIAMALNLATVSSPTILALPTTAVSFATQFAESDPYTQQADPDYTNPQYDPAVAMGPNGQFVIAWANLGQDLSWFNNISMQRYDENGNAVSFVGAVGNAAPTNYDYDPGLAMGQDGDVVVTYSETADAERHQRDYGRQEVFARAFNAQVGAALELVFRGRGRPQHHLHGRSRRLRSLVGSPWGNRPQRFCLRAGLGSRVPVGKLHQRPRVAALNGRCVARTGTAAARAAPGTAPDTAGTAASSCRFPIQHADPTLVPAAGVPDVDGSPGRWE